MGSITGRKNWTYEEYSQLNDDKRYEIINGELIMVPAPDLNHQDISRNLEVIMWLFIKQNGLGVLYDAPIDVVFDNHQVVQPDLVFISKENSQIIQKNNIKGSPDLIVEIISPSSVKRDRHDKFNLYESYKVKEYWLIDPANKTIEIFLLENDKYKLFCFAEPDGKAVSSVIKDFQVEVNDIIS